MKKRFMILGQNIQTSLSPFIHNRLFRDKDRRQLAYQVTPEGTKPPTIQHMLQSKQLGGITLTIPYKKYYYQNEPQSSLFTYHGELARDKKIINTIVHKENHLEGYNTDIWAIHKLLKPILSSQNEINVCILGAGATAETFCYYLQHSQSIGHIYLLNRTREKAILLQHKYPKIVVAQSSPKVSLIVNTLPSEVYNSQYGYFLHDHLELLANNGQVKETLHYMDVNYRDKQRKVQNMLGKHTKIDQIFGIDMLIWQAIEQNRLFCQEDQVEDKIMHQQFTRIKSQINQQISFT